MIGGVPVSPGAGWGLGGASSGVGWVGGPVLSGGLSGCRGHSQTDHQMVEGPPPTPTAGRPAQPAPRDNHGGGTSI